MARIRSVKPEFFRHEPLQKLEAAHPGQHVILTFAALWGHCDKAGNFRWRPRDLRLDILPFLDFDIEATLDLLWRADYIRRYEVDGREYGHVPTFRDHQVIRGTEASSPAKHPVPSTFMTPAVAEKGNHTETPRKPQEVSTTQVVVTSEVSRNGNPLETPRTPSGDQEGKGTVVGNGVVEPRHTRRGYSDPFGFRVNPSVVAVVVDERQRLELPPWWSKRQRERYGLAPAAIEDFASWLAADVRAAGGRTHGAGEKFDAWLDARWAAWRQSIDRPNDGLRPAQEFIDEQQRIAALIDAEDAAAKAAGTYQSPSEILRASRLGRAAVARG